ncbi:hypothetical protein N7519_004782 [Penicillium mononematosum]|uniref:uncharacterized protein n=1 Tax=Penicillium mononematosum TaxID=268346 RepID=UPI002546C73B|nr:uncharacterized protein N7519_004782 [Penicillium mononematosum]KAJ6189874.1 hypothetical protein N7519_004782 [Penicillium mononematosum]
MTALIASDGSKLTIAMDEYYDYKISPYDFDPPQCFPRITNLGNRISEGLSGPSGCRALRGVMLVILCLHWSYPLTNDDQSGLR